MHTCIYNILLIPKLQVQIGLHSLWVTETENKVKDAATISVFKSDEYHAQFSFAGCFIEVIGFSTSLTAYIFMLDICILITCLQNERKLWYIIRRIFFYYFFL